MFANVPISKAAGKRNIDIDRMSYNKCNMEKRKKVKIDMEKIKLGPAFKLAGEKKQKPWYKRLIDFILSW